MSDAGYNLEQPQPGAQLFTPPVIPSPPKATLSELFRLRGPLPPLAGAGAEQGLWQGLPPSVDPQSLADRRTAQPLPASVSPQSLYQPLGGGRQQIESFWAAQGVPSHVAQGIADAVGGESGFNPAAWNPDDKGSPSGGYYQHHADRLEKLKSFAGQQGRPWTDPQVQNAFALSEVRGGDPIAAAHWREIASAPDRATAKALWARYFERGEGSGAMGAANTAAAGVRLGYAKLADTYRSQADTAMREAAELKGSVYDQMKLVREALSKSDKAQEEAQKAIGKAPAQPEIDGMKHMAGLATVVGILGGLFTRSPMRASLNAAAAAIEAYNDNDRETYKRSYDTWKNQTDMLFKIADMNASRVRDVLYAENMGFNERRAAVDVLLRAQGQAALADQAKISGDQWLAEFIQKSDSAQEAKKLRISQMEFTHELALARMDQKPEERMFREWEQQWKADPAHNGQPPTLDEQAAAWHKIKSAGAGAKSSAAHNVKVLDKDGKTVWVGAAEKTPEGWVASGTGEKLDIPTGGRMDMSSVAPGRQAATQINALIGSSNEILPALKNLVDLPISATMGWFMGAQSHTPSGLTDAIKKSLASQVTSDEAKAIQTRFAGISRALATIEAQGRATGLVGLQKMNEAALIPQEGDSGVTILGKYAEIRQIVEQNVETISASPDIADTQRKLLEKVRRDIQEAVPWTVRDVNNLIRGQNDDQTVRQFAEKVISSKLPEGVPEGSKKVGTKDGNDVYEAPDGKRYMVH